MSKKDSSKSAEQTTNLTSEANEEHSASPSFSSTTQSDMQVVLTTTVVRIWNNKGNYVPMENERQWLISFSNDDGVF